MKTTNEDCVGIRENTVQYKQLARCTQSTQCCSAWPQPRTCMRVPDSCSICRACYQIKWNSWNNVKLYDSWALQTRYPGPICVILYCPTFYISNTMRYLKLWNIIFLYIMFTACMISLQGYLSISRRNLWFFPELTCICK